ncbi:hypothetical protein BDP81DRAFT_2842 [Colletotrichum phormii]|uniref:Uncharacterized protein n=1 Tax=Colletotrichum phormii TaxID=359342 RepID=A0AAJ0A5B3_9PEZI|nr:uncharacterized protein BDP81DRAFT_2842 [Colletotrichum phormii]KAK1655346.1 hypothetical protein BDP81DRAFT_2842 [Colletotrichum phormii]
MQPLQTAIASLVGSGAHAFISRQKFMHRWRQLLLLLLLLLPVKMVERRNSLLAVLVHQPSRPSGSAQQSETVQKARCHVVMPALSFRNTVRALPCPARTG